MTDLVDPNVGPLLQPNDYVFVSTALDEVAEYNKVYNNAVSIVKVL